MNQRQKIIVSITGIFIVLLTLVGLTYAYFLTRITGNEEEKSISVTIVNLELRYDDASEDIIINIAMPNTIAVKKFTVTNSGNAKVTDYQVYLENVVNELERNVDSKHPIALLSADELVMAGAFKSTKNQAYYLYDSYANGTSNYYWWSLSPYLFSGSFAGEFLGGAPYNTLNSLGVDSGYGSRPVINLRSNVLIESGDGTDKGPYILKEIS